MKKNKIFGIVLPALAAILFLTVTQINAVDVLADEQNETFDVVNEEIFLPVGGVAPTLEIPIEESKLPSSPAVVKARIRSPLQRAFVEPQVPGGTRYGYDWISNNTNTGSDSIKLAAIYEALVTYADLAYKNTNEYIYAISSKGNDYYHSGVLDLSTLDLLIDMSGSAYDDSGPNSKKSMSLINLAWSAFARDNPQYYMFGVGFSFGYSYSSSEAKLTSLYPLIYADYKDYSYRQGIEKIINTKFAEYKQLADTVSTEFDKARIVHDKILAERDYSYYGGVPDGRAPAHNILGVLDLSTQGPVCEAYAEAYAYILNRLGIDTITIFGVAGGGGHAWNLVKIGSEYYYVDSTWNDFETVGNPSGTYNDEGNLKNALYYRYFMVGNNNLNFSTQHTPGTPSGASMYYLFGLPSNISSTDYNTMTGSSYKWLNDNGFFNLSSKYGPEYNYYIGYSNNVGYPITSLDALFVDNGDWEWNGNSSHDFGSYTIAELATDIPVKGSLWLWDFDRTKDGFNNQFFNPVALTQDTDYEIVVEKPYHSGLNRAYIYGINGYKGIDFAIINLTFGSASAAIDNLTVSGTTGAALTDNPTASITLTNASVVRGGLINEDATSWFNNIPEGVTATANATSLSSTIELTFSGTSTAASNDIFNISIPESAQTSGSDLNIITNPNAKFEITIMNAQTPIINTQPTGATYNYNNEAIPISVTSTVSDGGTLTYQWYSNSINSNVGGSIIFGEESSSFTPPTVAVGTTYYYVVVTNTNNSASVNKTATTTSNTAEIIVKANPLVGTVVVNNTTPRIGDTLTGSLVDGNNTGTLMYSWKSDGVVVGSGETYTVTLDELGKQITLELTSDIEIGVLVGTATSAVAKKVAPTAPAAPTVESKTHNSVTLTANELYEFSNDGVLWQSSNTFTGLTPNTDYSFYQRVAETSDTEASYASTELSVMTLDNEVIDSAIFFRVGEGLFDASVGGNEILGKDVTWSVDDSTLTLSNFNFTTSTATALQIPDGVTIVLEGENIITSTYESDGNSFVIHANGNLNIQGSGTLNVICGLSNAGNTFGIRVTGNLEQSSGTVNITANADSYSNNSFGVYVINKFSMDGGTLAVRGNINPVGVGSISGHTGIEIKTNKVANVLTKSQFLFLIDVSNVFVKSHL